MAKVDSLEVLITADSSQLQSGLKDTSKGLNNLSKQANKSSGIISSEIGKMAAKFLSLAAVVKLATKSISESMQRIEDENLFEVSLGKNADAIRNWSEDVEKSVGVSAAWLRKSTGVFSNMTQSMGLSSEQAAKLGRNFSILAQDMASFYNIKPEEAMNKLQSGLAGNSRALQELGIMVKEADIEQTALALGVKKVNGEFTSAQRALLTYQTVINATKNAQGDLARTINTPANQLRMLTTNIQNLGVAIGNMFQPLLSVALPALNGLIIAATRAARAIAGLFGIKMTSSSGSDLATSVGGVSSGLDEATGSAKKLKKTLASFDEMNVLQEQDASGGGGGGGGGGGAGALPTIDWDAYNGGFENVRNKALEIADSIQAAFRNMFDVETIKNAFVRFFTDVQEALGPVKDVVSDIWNSYLKPLVSWAGNSLLPAFLNALGGAIQFVGSFISTYYKTVMKPWYDNFLVPIAKWTGGKIVSILNKLGDALRKVSKDSDKMEKVVKIVNNVAKAILAVWSALRLVETYNKVATFANGFIGQLADRGLPTLLENTATGMRGIAAGSELFKKVGEPIVGLIGNIKTMFSSLFSVIAAHPIAALIAVLSVLLLTNEDLRASLFNMLESILRPIISVIQTLFSVVSPVVDIISNIASIIGSVLSIALEAIASVLTAIFDVLSPLIEVILTVFTALNPLVLLIEAAKPLLDLVAAVLKIVADALKGVLDFLKPIFDAVKNLGKGFLEFIGISQDTEEQTNNLNRELSEQEKQFDRNSDGALDYAERLEYLKNVINNANRAEEDLIEAQRRQVEKYQALKVFCDKYNLSAEELIKLHRENKLSTLASGDALDELTLAIIGVEKANYQVESATKAFDDEQGELQSQANQAKEALDEEGKELVKLGETGQKGSKRWLELTESIKKHREQIALTGKEVGNITNWEAEAERAAKNVVQGAANGVRNNAWRYIGEIRNMAKQGEIEFNRYNVIKSPSRLFRKLGGYIAEGAALGVESEYGTYENSLRGLAQVGQEAFEGYEVNTDITSDMKNSLSEANLASNIDLDYDKTPIHLTVNVGEDNLLNKIIDGVNDASYLMNKNVINV